MVSLLKTFAKGLLYVIGMPFFIFALALFGAIGLIAFIFQLIKSVIFFFTGHKFFPELPEDKELRLLKEGNNAPSIEETVFEKEESKEEIITPLVREPIVAPVEPVKEETTPSSIEDVCFKEEAPIHEEVKEEVTKEDVSEDISLNQLLNNDVAEEEQEEAPIGESHEEETVLQTKEEVESDEDLVEELETYVPRSSNYSETVDEDDDNTDIGVDIHYDL